MRVDADVLMFYADVVSVLDTLVGHRCDEPLLDSSWMCVYVQAFKGR
jgi:hypothetical protein